jgi:hypothetical protein
MAGWYFDVWGGGIGEKKAFDLEVCTLLEIGGEKRSVWETEEQADRVLWMGREIIRLLHQIQDSKLRPW